VGKREKAMQSETEKRMIAKCEGMGIDKARHNLITGTWAGRNAKYAQAWLDREVRREEATATADQDALARSQASAALDSAEASQIQAEEAREANRIAREANTKAHTANTIATLALIAAIVAIAVTVLDAFLD
jgi:hypothetical protein